MNKLQQISLYLFFFSMNFEVWDPFHTDGFFSISKLAGIIYLLVSIPDMRNFRTADEVRPVFKLILLFFGLLTLMNAIHAESVSDHLFDLTIFQNLVLFWILINHEQKDPLVLEKGMLSFAIGSATLALLFANGTGVEYVDGRVSVFGDNQNIIGQRMSVSIIILLMTILQNRLQLNRTRYFLFLLIPGMLGLLVASGSRLAILSFALAFIAGVILLKTKSYSLKIIVLTMGFVSFFFIWQFAMENEVLRTRLLLSLREGQLSERDVIWGNILPLIQSNPVFGIGQTGYTTFCMNEFGRYISPHSVIMELIVFTGLTGLTIYAVFLYKIFRKGYLSYKKNGFLLPVLLMLIVIGLLLGSHILEIKPGWCILAYIATSATAYGHETGADFRPVTVKLSSVEEQSE